MSLRIGFTGDEQLTQQRILTSPERVVIAYHYQPSQPLLAQLLKGADHQHKDNLKDVDDCLLLDKIGNLYVHLTPDENGQPFRPEWQGINRSALHKRIFCSGAIYRAVFTDQDIAR